PTDDESREAMYMFVVLHTASLVDPTLARPEAHNVPLALHSLVVTQLKRRRLAKAVDPALQATALVAMTPSLAQAVLDGRSTVADTAYAMHAALPLDDLKSELTVLVLGSLLLFDATEDWIRLRAKEADQFPKLFGGSRDLAARAYRYLADWLASKVDAGVLAA